MRNIADVTGITFLPKAAGHQNYIHFIHDDGNYSYLGKVGGKQVLSILKNQTFVVGITMHELLHALGMFHEMSRDDRDKYIEILWDNIVSDKKFAFQKFSELNNPGANIDGFNFNSIMMYPSNAFGKNTNNVVQQTIRRIDGKPYYAQRSYLAGTDISALRSIYGPPYVKVRREKVYIDYYNDDYDYRLEADYPTYVDFYEDKECTIPATLDRPRFLNIVRIETINGTSASPIYTTQVVPAGVSSHLVGTGYANITESWGSPVLSRTIDYSVVNCHKNGYGN